MCVCVCGVCVCVRARARVPVSVRTCVCMYIISLVSPCYGMAFITICFVFSHVSSNSVLNRDHRLTVKTPWRGHQRQRSVSSSSSLTACRVLCSGCSWWCGGSGGGEGKVVGGVGGVGWYVCV